MKNSRRLSPLRVILALLIVAGIFYGSSLTWSRVQEKKTTTSLKPWFASYVDVTATPTYSFERVKDASAKNNIVLSFIVSSAAEPCTPTWGNTFTPEQAGLKLDLDRRIARFKQQGGNIAISFGGLLNNELAMNCKDSEKLREAYSQIIDRYDIDTLDFDLEGSGLTDTQALKRRALVVADLQKAMQSDNKQLAVWLTLPVAPQGLTSDGTNAVAEMLASGVDLTGVNVMTMDYGDSREQNQTMQQASERALIETHRQLGILYDQAGIRHSEASLWAKIGATPMIGQNDIASEIFSLEDAAGFNEFAVSKGIARMSMWSANRDIQCGENYVNVVAVSDSCSGVKQIKSSFAAALGKGFDGDINSNEYSSTIKYSETKQEPDDPWKSPYQIWSEATTYLEGTKVVWHHNVYQAKWWNKGDTPDNPVLQAWETPWQLLGPVLPGETPIPQPTLPPGTYPVWAGAEVYEAGQRVLFNGIPYQAKWWTQGDSPAASTSNPDSSPWVLLNQKEI